MDADKIDATRAAIKADIARILRADKAFEAIAPEGKPLPGKEALFEKAGQQIDAVVARLKDNLGEIFAVLGDLYDIDMDWPTDEEVWGDGGK